MSGRKPHPQNQIDEAARLYIQEGLSIAQIAEGDTAFAPTTLRRWAVRDDWEKKRRQFRRNENELEDLLARIKLHLARLLLSEDGEEISENLDPKQIYAVCRAVAVLNPPAAVLLKRMEQEELEAESVSADDRMFKVMELLKGAGFIHDDPAGRS